MTLGSSSSRPAVVAFARQPLQRAAIQRQPDLASGQQHAQARLAMAVALTLMDRDIAIPYRSLALYQFGEIRPYSNRKAWILRTASGNQGIALVPLSQQTAWPDLPSWWPRGSLHAIKSEIRKRGTNVGMSLRHAFWVMLRRISDNQTEMRWRTLALHRIIEDVGKAIMDFLAGLHHAYTHHPVTISKFRASADDPINRPDRPKPAPGPDEVDRLRKHSHPSSLHQIITVPTPQGCRQRLPGWRPFSAGLSMPLSFEEGATLSCAAVTAWNAA